MRRGQLSVEFIILVTFMLVVFLAFFFLVNNEVISFQEDEAHSYLKDVSDMITKEIEIAQNARNGYERTFTLPANIGEVAYEIDTTRATVKFADEPTEHIFILPNSTNNINLEPGRQHKITKQDDEINIYIQ